MKKTMTFGIILGFLILFKAICIADTIYVDPSGAGDYTNISDAISNAYPDDTIIVNPGLYEEAVIIDKDLTLRGMGPQRVQIYSPLTGVQIMGSVTKTSVIGFTITGFNHGIYLESSPNPRIIELKNNVICSNGQRGIRGTSNNKTTVNITNCVVANNGTDGIYMGDEHTFLYSNIVVSNGGYGIYGAFDWGGENFNSQYNDVWNNPSGDYGFRAEAGTGDISENPDFIDYAIGNYVLRNDSPCINAGRPGSGDADPDGSRNDMGAYGGPACASFWPYPPGTPIITDLSVTPSSVPKGTVITINATGEVYE
jgi:hypothetical protein